MNDSLPDVPELVYRLLEYLDAHGGIVAVVDLPRNELCNGDVWRLAWDIGLVRYDPATQDQWSNCVPSLIMEPAGKTALARWRLQPKRESDLPDTPADGVPSAAERAAPPLSQEDFDSYFKVVWGLLYAAAELHKAALEKASESRTDRLTKTLKNLYQHLCSHYAPFDPPVGQGPGIIETQRQVTIALIAIAGGANNSPVTRAFRYAEDVWKCVWGSTEREPIFMTVRKLSGSELKRALKALDGKGRDLLRTLEPMDYDLQVDRMQGEICRAGIHEGTREAVAKALVSAAGDTGGLPTGDLVPKSGNQAKQVGGRKRLTKQQVEFRTHAAILHKIEHPEATEEEAAKAAKISRTTLRGRREWQEWSVKIESAATDPTMIVKLKAAFDKRTGEIVASSEE